MIDERASLGFAAADRYHAYRPSYPPAATAFIREAAGFDERSTVVDLGAGTGLMTRLLSPVGRLIAIEPVPSMRETLRRQVLEAEVIEGSAEEMPLRTAEADAIVVAQAFHWFANLRALSEIARVLKPEGALVLVWNVRDPHDLSMKRIDAILEPYRLNSPGFASTPWRELFDEAESPMRLISRDTFPFEEQLTLRRLKGRVLSTSYIALLQASLRSAILRELEGLFDSATDGAHVVMPYTTDVCVARRK